MNMKEFFNHCRVQPIFQTTRTIRATMYHWLPGEQPKYRRVLEIPTGTKIIHNGYSNYGTGHSMTPLHCQTQFFVCPYDAMEFVEYKIAEEEETK